jgi:hypothetical protein
VAALQALRRCWDNPGNTAHVFLAACMVCADKTARHLAGELWLQGVSLGQLNQ